MQVGTARTAEVYKLKPPPAQEDEIILKDIGQVCRFMQREIIASKWKYARIAREADVCAQTVSRLVHGETRQPRFLTIMAILHALGFELTARR